MKEVIKVRKEQKWKYTVDYKSMNLTSSGDTEKFLNKMGINGWELINIQKIPFTKEDDVKLFYYFKRPLND